MTKQSVFFLLFMPPGAVRLSRNRLLAIIFLFLSIGLHSYGQQGGNGFEFDSLGYEVDSLGMLETYNALRLELEGQSQICYPLGISKIVPVLHQDAFSLYVQLTAQPSAPIFLELAGDYSEAVPVQEHGAIVLRNLPLNQHYMLTGNNSCGELAPFFSFYTDSQLYAGKEGVTEVFSEEMFSLASAFAAQDELTALPLHEFLNAAEEWGVHPFEKLNFYQQFAMWGEPYDATPQNDELPGTYHKPLERREDCECAFVKLSPSASPAAGTIEFLGQEFFQPVGEESNFSGVSNVNKFHWWQVKGAAKNILSYTSGWKADCDQEHSLSANHAGEAEPDIDETEDVELLRSPVNYGRIAVSLLCNDGNQLPKECDCSKKILFDYEYRNALTARAERGSTNFLGCNRKRQAAAHVEDFVMVTFEKRQSGENPGSNNETRIMDFNRWVFGAECGTQVNPEWDEAFAAFVEAVFGEVTLGDVVNVISGNGSFGDIVNTGTEIPELVSAIATWVRTQRFADVPCQTATRFGGVDHKYEFTLFPNDEIWFNIRSSGVVRSQGQRSWQAEARIRSRFAMTVQTFPGSTDEPNLACCSDWGAAYAGATLMPGGPAEQTSLQATLAEFMNGTLQSYPDCTITGAYGPVSRGERGVCSTPARADCRVPVLEGRSGGSGTLDWNAPVPVLIREASLFDIQGRLLDRFNGRDFANFAALESFLRERAVGRGYPAGIYFVRYHNGKSAETRKLFLAEW
jgi:hypothetical protein